MAKLVIWHVLTPKTHIRLNTQCERGLRLATDARLIFQTDKAVCGRQGWLLLFLFNVPVNNVQSFWDGATASWVFTTTLGTLICLAQGHYTAVVGLEPWTSRSGVHSSTTEPPRPRSPSGLSLL